MLYIRNLSSDVTEDSLKEKFTEFGKIDRVKKIKVGLDVILHAAIYKTTVILYVYVFSPLLCNIICC